MAQDNPYAAPVSDAGRRDERGLDEDRLVTPEIREALEQTRPWVVFMAVLGFIGTGALVLMAVGVFAFGTFVGAGYGAAGFVACLYVGVAGVYLLCALNLWRYGASIALLGQGYGVHALTEALRQQKAFWRIAGLATIGSIVLTVGFVLLTL
jgi:hypothetical protein